MQAINKDLATGALLIAIGAYAILMGQDYGVATIRRMGPGFFPVMIGGGLVVLGVIIIVVEGFGKRRSPVPATPGNLRALLLVSAAIGAFAVLVRTAGLVPAVWAAVFVSSLADPGMRLGSALLVSVVMSVIAVVGFVWGLGFQAAPFGRY